ncbi:MAG: hypothetical protein ACJ8DJ_03645, partial [Gemmatimonadales bacterium]
DSEVELRTLTVEGILAVQAGDNPRVVADKLHSYVPPELRADRAPTGAAGAAAAVEEAPAEPMAA